MPTTRDLFEPSDHPALMRHFESIGFDPYACSAPVQIYRPSTATVAERYRTFISRASNRLERDDASYAAMLDQIVAGFRDRTSFPAPQV